MATNQYVLCSLDNVKNFLEITVSGTDDLISELINRYSILFETYMGKNILSREYTEYYDGGGHSELFTAQYPITVVSGIWDDSDWSWPDSTLVDATDYMITRNEDSIVFKYTTLNDNSMNIKIIYTAGYSSIPEDIKMACIEEVAKSYKGRQEINVLSKTLGDGSVSFHETDLLSKTKLTLNRYRRISIC